MKVDADAVTASAKGYTGRLAAGLSSGCHLWACASLLQGTMRWAPGLLAGLQCWSDNQPVRLAGSFRCWFVKKYCWLVCVREKYCSGWKFRIVYDKPQPN